MTASTPRMDWPGSSPPFGVAASHAPSAAAWWLPWSDLMLTMFVLFLTLYVARPPRPELQHVDRATPVFAGAPVATHFGEGDEAGHYVLSGDLLFAPGRAEVRRAAYPLLEKIAGVLAGRVGAVNVVGHADESPIRTERFPSNWELSTARAAAVARLLTERFGLDASRVFLTGYGHYAPRRVGSDPSDLAANRRVEIVLRPRVRGVGG